MKHQLSKVYWGRVLLASIVASGLSFWVTALVIFIYAFSLAFQVRGAPDQARINYFAELMGRWGAPIIAFLLTVMLATWVARKAKAAASLHSLLIGLLVASIGLMLSLAFSLTSGKPFGVSELVAFILAVGAGWLGGVLGRPRQPQL